MERVLARRAPLARQLLVGAHNAVANGALRLPLHRGRHVLPPRHQAVDDGVALADAAGGEVDDALGVDDPEAPLLLLDADAVDRLDLCAGERVRGGRRTAMVMVFSSMGIEAVISRAEGETLTVIGWSAVDCEGAHSLMTESSWAMTRGRCIFVSRIRRLC